MEFNSIEERIHDTMSSMAILDINVMALSIAVAIHISLQTYNKLLGVC